MRILVIGDLHIDKNNLTFINYALTEILEIAKSERPDLIVSCGDSLHRHSEMYLRSHVIAERFYIEVAKICPLVVLIGNHDRENKSDFMTDIHPFTGLCHVPNITIVYQTVCQTFPTGEKYIYVPYVDTGRFREALSFVNYDPEFCLQKPGILDAKNPGENKPDMIFCHQEFRGGMLSSVASQASQEGDPWNKDLPIVIAGHLHLHHLVNSNLIYVGTPIQHSYGEDQDKALMLITCNKNPDGFKMNYSRIPLKSPPKRITVQLKLADLPNFSAYIPPNNAILSKYADVRFKTLVCVKLQLDATEIKSLETNQFYHALEKTVDKLELVVTGTKASHAQTILQNASTDGEGGVTKKNVNLEQIVQSLLQDDQDCLKIFNSEICS